MYPIICGGINIIQHHTPPKKNMYLGLPRFNVTQLHHQSVARFHISSLKIMLFRGQCFAKCTRPEIRKTVSPAVPAMFGYRWWFLNSSA